MYIEFLQEVALETLRRGEIENAKVIFQAIGGIAMEKNAKLGFGNLHYASQTLQEGQG